MKVLIDTNVVLDVLLERHPFYQDSFVIFQLADQFIVAKENSIDRIITRNAKDYETSNITCLSPTEFIASLRGKD